MTAIIDYDAGNIRSVENAVRYLGHEAVVTADSSRILSADHVILPGVGAFGDAMEKLRSAGLEDTIRQAVKAGIPFLGICLGLQLLFEESEESPGVKGLCLLPGRIRRNLRKYPYFSQAWPSRRLDMAGDPDILAPIPGIRVYPEPPAEGSSILQHMLDGE